MILMGNGSSKRIMPAARWIEKSEIPPIFVLEVEQIICNIMRLHALRELVILVPGGFDCWLDRVRILGRFQ
jgi:hypothetical protein